MAREQHLSGVTVPERVIPWPSPDTVSMFQNINRNSLLFLRATGIQDRSEKHKTFKATIQALYRQHLDPAKYTEEQAPGRVDQLINQAQIRLPWLVKYEDCWPARIYLKRYVDTRRPHLNQSRYARRKEIAKQKSKTRPSRNACRELTGNAEDPGDVPGDHDSVVREFLGSLAPSLEHHLDAFVEFGVKDQESLEAFLSWPQVTQAQFLEDQGHGVLRLTSVEKQDLLLGCGLLTQRALRGSLASIVKSGCFHP